MLGIPLFLIIFFTVLFFRLESGIFNKYILNFVMHSSVYSVLGIIANNLFK